MWIFKFLFIHNQSLQITVYVFFFFLIVKLICVTLVSKNYVGSRWPVSHCIVHVLMDVIWLLVVNSYWIYLLRQPACSFYCKVRDNDNQLQSALSYYGPWGRPVSVVLWKTQHIFPWAKILMEVQAMMT